MVVTIQEHKAIMLDSVHEKIPKTLESPITSRGRGYRCRESRGRRSIEKSPSTARGVEGYDEMDPVVL